MRNQIQDKSIAAAGRDGCVTNQTDEVDAFQCIVYGGHHSAVELITWFVHSGGVDKDNLALGSCYYTLDSVASSLGFIGDCRDFFTHQPVQKSTFPGIGAANQRDVTSAKGRGRITFLRIHLQFENVVCLPLLSVIAGRVRVK